MSNDKPQNGLLTPNVLVTLMLMAGAWFSGTMYDDLQTLQDSVLINGVNINGIGQDVKTVGLNVKDIDASLDEVAARIQRLEAAQQILDRELEQLRLQLAIPQGNGVL